MNIMIAAAGVTDTIPAGGAAEGVLFILFFAAAGLLFLSGANVLLRRTHRPHRVRYSEVRH